jgi:pyruvate-formate lyase
MIRLYLTTYRYKLMGESVIMSDSNVKYGIFEKHSWKDVLWNIGNRTAGFTRRYYFYQEHDGERTLLAKKALLTLLSTNEDMKNYISKDERYKQYISPDNIVMRENGDFFAGLINMDYIKKIVNYLNSRVESNK